MSKLLYEYLAETGEFTAANEATPDPLRPGEYLMRMNATFIEPPESGEHEIAVFKDGKWELVPDYRGTVYWYRGEDGQVVQVEEKKLGIAPPEGAVFERGALPKTEEEIAQEARMGRDMLLHQADILIYKAEDAGEDTTALREYRQVLRDVPEQEGFPENIVWPDLP
ncbi:MAG: phage tail assembly chaperone [Paraprevotella sp.]|nr:phage tail assembly chaperone [Paraprevotella sp.]